MAWSDGNPALSLSSRVQPIVRNGSFFCELSLTGWVCGLRPGLTGFLDELWLAGFADQVEA